LEATTIDTMVRNISDTDMLPIVPPTLNTMATIFTIKMGKDRYLLLVSLFMQYHNWCVFSNYSLSLAMAVIPPIYTLIFHRRDIFLYKILAIMLLSLAKGGNIDKGHNNSILFFALQNI